MRLLLISEKGPIINTLVQFCKSEHWFLVTYHLPMKALDNISEISPDALLINAADFPRQWKVLLQCLNAEQAAAQIRTFLLAEKNFSPANQEKAKALGVTAILQIDSTDLQAELQKLSQVH